MTKRRNISSGTHWEDQVGYSRAVRVGRVVEVSGTTAVDDNGEIVGAGNPYEQAKFIFSKIEKALVGVGVTLDDVIRTRMFVTDITRWQEVGRAHGEVFKDIRPSSTMVQVGALIDPALLVEIEVTAIDMPK
jgi:enamine deaminase RidA (YjgF/YER057c/UK114 family)